jgi:putative chitinase
VLAVTPAVMFRTTGLFWQRRGLNEIADAGSDDGFREITKRINGGFNGLAQRQGYYATAKSVLAPDKTP